MTKTAEISLRRNYRLYYIWHLRRNRSQTLKTYLVRNIKHLFYIIFCDCNFCGPELTAEYRRNYWLYGYYNLKSYGSIKYFCDNYISLINKCRLNQRLSQFTLENKCHITVYVFSFDGGQDKKDKKTNNDLQNNTQKTKH